MANDIGVDYTTVAAALYKINRFEVGRVDENMFLALYFNVDEEEPTAAFRFESSLCKSVCDRCSRLMLSKDFLCSKSGTLRTHCFRCRGDDPIMTHPQNVFSRIDLESVEGERFAAVHLMNLESAALTGKGFDCCYVERRAAAITEPDGQPFSETKNEDSRGGAEDRVREVLFKIEGYRYARSKSGALSDRKSVV